jgi:hypothetical protein
MASDVEIINTALRGLGAVSIAARTEDSENARKMNAVYDIFLKSLLRIHPWSFAKKETTLSRLTDSPVLDDYIYIYSLPSDFVRLNKTSVEPSYSHKIKGRKLYSNADSISIEYVYFNDDPSTYDDMFVDAFAARLAAELCYAITRDKDMVKIKWQEYASKLRLAQSQNGQEVSIDEFQQDQWLNSRY